MSATPEPPIPVSAIRRALSVVEAASSERAAAEAVGMSQRGLRKFLAGAKPQAATLNKLNRWYFKHASRGTFLDAETAEAAINILVSSLPEGERGVLRRQLQDLLREAHERAGTEPPEWLK